MVLQCSLKTNRAEARSLLDYRQISLGKLAIGIAITS